MPNEDNNTEPTVAEQARALIEADKKARVAEGIRRIDEVCKDLRIQLVPVYVMRSGQGTHTIDVVALD